MNMRKNVLGIVCVISAALAGQAAQGAEIFTGSLSGADGGLLGTGQWTVAVTTPTGEPEWSPPTLSWTVSQNEDLSWHYAYTLSVSQANVKHLIIEASATMGEDEIFNGVATAGTIRRIKVDNFDYGAIATPYLPESVYGIKFARATGLTLSVEFDSLRSPIWGDVYARGNNSGGMFNTVWNAGFGEEDPYEAPADGSLNNHVLVPGGLNFGGGEIPEPTTVAMLVTGATLVLVRSRRRRA